MPRLSILLCGLLGAFAMGATGVSASAHPPPGKSATTQPSASAPAAAKVVDAFHAALDRGDTAAAAALLADAAIVFEGGEVERSKAEYAGHHLPADVVFAQAVGSQMTHRRGGTSGDLAWVASEGRTQGRYNDREVDRITTETMLLQRFGGTWKIIHVHWSSRAAPKT